MRGCTPLTQKWTWKLISSSDVHLWSIIKSESWWLKSEKTVTLAPQQLAHGSLPPFTVLQNMRLQRSHVKPGTIPLILYSPITHRTDPVSSAPCSCPGSLPPSHGEPDGKWEWLPQLRKNQNTKIQQFLLHYCYLVPVLQPMSMLTLAKWRRQQECEQAAKEGGTVSLGNNTSLCQLRSTII